VIPGSGLKGGTGILPVVQAQERARAGHHRLEADATPKSRPLRFRGFAWK
jgi:hypothetical protein